MKIKDQLHNSATHQLNFDPNCPVCNPYGFCLSGGPKSAQEFFRLVCSNELANPYPAPGMAQNNGSLNGPQGETTVFAAIENAVTLLESLGYKGGDIHDDLVKAGKVLLTARRVDDWRWPNETITTFPATVEALGFEQAPDWAKAAKQEDTQGVR